MQQALKHPPLQETGLNRKHLLGRHEPVIPREKPGREYVACDARPECAGCTMAAHGFFCHFTDGSCLRCRAP